jgi:hypothetical protein
MDGAKASADNQTAGRPFDLKKICSPKSLWITPRWQGISHRTVHIAAVDRGDLLAGLV